MPYPFAWYVVLLMVAEGCASRPATTARAVTSPAPVPSPEALPVRHTEGPVTVSVDPEVQPERLRALFGMAWHVPFVLPVEFVLQNQGAQRLQLSQSDIALELPDGSHSRPLPVSTVVPGAVPPRTAGTFKEGPNAQARSSAEATAAAVFRTVLGLGALLSDQHAQDRAAATHVATYRSKEFQDVVLAQGESAHGFVFFTSPQERGFREATLRLRFVMTEASPDVVVRLPLYGVGESGRAGSK
jgi:hypothetical protein